MLTEDRIPRSSSAATDRTDGSVTTRSVDLEMQRRTCTHCGAYAWFVPDDLTGSWYHCDRCGATA